MVDCSKSAPIFFWVAFLSSLAPIAVPIAWPSCAAARAQLIAITEENGDKIAATIWSLNDARDVETFLSDAAEFSGQFRSLTSYAAADTPIEVACSHAGSITLRGMVQDDSVGVRTGETTVAEFNECAERNFLDITNTRNGTASLLIVDSADEVVTFDLTNEYTAVVESAILSEPVRGTFSGTTRYLVDLADEGGPSLTATSDIFSIVGSTPDGEQNLEVRAYESSLKFSGGNGVLNYAKVFSGRFEGTSLGGAAIVTTDIPLGGTDDGLPASGRFKADGAGGSNVAVEPQGNRVFVYVDGDGDGNDDDATPAIYEWASFEALAEN